MNKINRLSLYFYHQVYVIAYRNEGIKEFLGYVLVTHTAEDLTPKITAIREKFLSYGKMFSNVIQALATYGLTFNRNTFEIIAAN